MTQPPGEYLVDDLIDAYVEWREQSQRVSRAYKTWSNASWGDAGLRYAAYLEELDREQRACDLYADKIAVLASEP